MARRAPINRRMVTREASDTIVLFRDAWGEVDKRFDLGRLGLPGDVTVLLAEAFRGHHAGSSPDTQRGCYRALRLFATFAREEDAVAGAADIPQDEDALWDWLVDLDDASRTALLAHCVSYGVNALSEKVDRYGGSGISQHGLERRLKQADRIARAVGLDMAEAGWRPTVDNYLSRVTKPRILEAVREAKGEASAQLIDHLKKGDMANEAERLLADTGWLPEPLRLADLAGDPAPDAVAGTDDGAELPDFLSADDEAPPADGEDDERHLMAAE